MNEMELALIQEDGAVVALLNRRLKLKLLAGSAWVCLIGAMILGWLLLQKI